MSYCVYCHTNIKNGKRYIGITSQKPEQRWQKGRKYSNNLHFKRAIDECGWDGFLHEILYDNLSLAQAEQKEIELIKKYKCCDPEYGYNIERGGNSSYKYTDEVKEKISKSLKGKPKSEIHKKRISESKKGLSCSKETKKKISEAMSGARNPMYGKTRNIGDYKTKCVECIETGVVYISQYDASRKTGVQQSDISKACNGKLKTAGKLHWRFAEGVQ